MLSVSSKGTEQLVIVIFFFFFGLNGHLRQKLNPVNTCGWAEMDLPLKQSLPCTLVHPGLCVLSITALIKARDSHKYRI